MSNLKKKSSSKPVVIREIPSKIVEIKTPKKEIPKPAGSLEEEVTRIEEEVNKKEAALSKDQITPSLATQLQPSVQARVERDRANTTNQTREEKKDTRNHVYGETRRVAYNESEERQGYMGNRSRDYNANVSEKEDDKKKRDRLGTRGDGLMNTRDDRADQYVGNAPNQEQRADVYDVSSTDRKKRSHSF